MSRQPKKQSAQGTPPEGGSGVVRPSATKAHAMAVQFQAERDEARATAELHQKALEKALAREEESYEWLIAGIDPAMKVNPAAHEHMIASMRAHPLIVHLKMAANTIKHQSEELEKAQAFKTFVHKRLDEAGVPADPEPEENAKHGCRIEGRLNWLQSAVSVSPRTLDLARAQRDALAAEAGMLRDRLGALVDLTSELYEVDHEGPSDELIEARAALATPSLAGKWLAMRDDKICAGQRAFDLSIVTGTKDPRIASGELEDALAEHDAKVRAEVVAEIEADWQLAVGFLSNPTPASLAQTVAEHDDRVRRAGFAEAINAARELVLAIDAVSPVELISLAHDIGGIRQAAPRAPETAPAPMDLRTTPPLATPYPLEATSSESVVPLPLPPDLAKVFYSDIVKDRAAASEVKHAMHCSARSNPLYECTCGARR